MHCEQVMHALNSMVNNMYSALLKRIYCELFTGIHLHLKELNKLKCLQTFYWKKTPNLLGKNTEQSHFPFRKKSRVYPTFTALLVLFSAGGHVRIFRCVFCSLCWMWSECGCCPRSWWMNEAALGASCPLAAPLCVCTPSHKLCSRSPSQIKHIFINTS